MIHGQCNLYVYSGNAPAEEGAKSENRTNLFFLEMWKLRELSWFKMGFGREGRPWVKKWVWKCNAPIPLVELVMVMGDGQAMQEEGLIVGKAKKNKECCGEVFLHLWPNCGHNATTSIMAKEKKETSFVQLDCNLSSLLPCKVFKTNIKKIWASSHSSIQYLINHFSPKLVNSILDHLFYKDCIAMIFYSRVSRQRK